MQSICRIYAELKHNLCKSYAKHLEEIVQNICEFSCRVHTELMQTVCILCNLFKFMQKAQNWCSAARANLCQIYAKLDQLCCVIICCNMQIMKNISKISWGTCTNFPNGSLSESAPGLSSTSVQFAKQVWRISGFSEFLVHSFKGR